MDHNGTCRGVDLLGAGGKHPGKGDVDEGGVQHRVRDRGQEDESLGQDQARIAGKQGSLVLQSKWVINNPRIQILL